MIIILFFLSENGNKMAQNSSEQCLNQTEMSAKQIKYVFNPMEQGVRWTEKYALDIEKLWKSIPPWMGQVLATIAVFLLASCLHGMKMNTIFGLDFFLGAKLRPMQVHIFNQQVPWKH